MEKLIPRNQIPERVRQMTGVKASHSTVWRWYTHGRRGVLLNVQLVGGRVYTTDVDLRLFFAQATGVAKHRKRRFTKHKQTSETLSDQQVSARLDALGV